MGGPLGPFRDSVEQALKEQGYSTGRRAGLLLLMAHLSRWLEERHLAAGDLTGETAERFFVDFRARHRWCRSSKPLVPVLGRLREVGVVPVAGGVPSTQSAGDELLADFGRYLGQQRGLSPATVRAYQRYSRSCVRAWWPDGIAAPAELRASDVISVVRSSAVAMPPASLRCMVTALRALLRFFHATGRTSRPLAGAVPAMACWRPPAAPAPLAPDVMSRLLGSCDAATAIGRRDRAVLTLLTRLGLRAGEVSALTLDDIDWRAGEIRIAGKGGRTDRLPLPPDVGEALACYLRDGRPASRHRAVFLKAVAPFGPFTPATVGGVVAMACDRAGVARFGPHRLRHLVGTETLRAGASLEEVAQLLRHAKAATSSIYAVPDPAAVAGLARAWPGATR
jgi:integrase/recombinase XerD